MLLPRFLFVVFVLSVATARHHFQDRFFDRACDNETVSQGVLECLDKMPEKAQLIVKLCGSALNGDTSEYNETLANLCENRDFIPKFAHCVGRVSQDIFDFARHLQHQDYDHHDHHHQGHHGHHGYHGHDHSGHHHHEHDQDDFDMHAHEGHFHADVHYHGHHDHRPDYHGSHGHKMVHSKIFKKFQEFVLCFENSLPEETVDNSTSSSNDELSQDDYNYYD